MISSLGTSRPDLGEASPLSGGGSEAPVSLPDIDALREDYQRQQRAFQTATIAHAFFKRQQRIGVLLSDEDGHILEANAVSCAMLQRDEAEIRQLGWDKLTHPPDLSLDRELVAKTAAGQIKGYGLIKHYLLPDGELLPVHITVLRLNGVFERARFLVMVEHWHKPIQKAAVLWLEQ